jgi:hypothetical protein
MLMNLPTMGPHYGKKWSAGRGEAVAAPSKKSCQRACESESGTVFRLPPEIYEKILLNLQPKDLVAASIVCKEWNEVTSNDRLWKALCASSFGYQLGLAKLPSWKELFISLVCIPKFLSDRERIRDAFSVLRGIGFNAKMSFECCNSCAWSRIECRKSGAVFWTIPADSAFDMDRNIQSPLFLQWFGDARVICSVLRSRGLIVREPSTKSSAIAVFPGTSYDNMIEYSSYTTEKDCGGYVSDGDSMDADEEDED